MIGLDAQSVTVGVAGGTLFSNPRFRSGAFDRVFTVGSDLPFARMVNTSSRSLIANMLQLDRPCQSGAVILKPLQNLIVAQSYFAQASVDCGQV